MEPHLSRGGGVGLFVLDRREETAVAPTALRQAATAKAPTPVRRSARHFRPGGRISVVSRPATAVDVREQKEGSP
jgi:hypothetical protein